MLFFLGGAARTGKGIIARRLLADASLPFLSVDAVKMGLLGGAPEFAMNPHASGLEVAERMWPVVRAMSRTLLEDRVGYLLEGELAPKHIAEFRSERPEEVAACFIGYATIEPERKLRDIRNHPGHPNDWTASLSDRDLLAFLDGTVAFSRYLRAECKAHGFHYFDTSQDFDGTLNEVVAYIRRAMAADR